MKRLFYSVVLTAGLAIVPLATWAAPYGPPCDAPPGNDRPGAEEDTPGVRHFERLAAILDLSGEQRQKIDALRDAEMQATEPYRRQLHESREAIHALVRIEPFDETAVRRLARSKADAAVELQVAHARTRSQIYALLTPEQRALAERLEMGLGQRGPGRHGFARSR